MKLDFFSRLFEIILAMTLKTKKNFKIVYLQVPFAQIFGFYGNSFVNKVMPYGWLQDKMYYCKIDTAFVTLNLRLGKTVKLTWHLNATGG